MMDSRSSILIAVQPTLPHLPDVVEGVKCRIEQTFRNRRLYDTFTLTSYQILHYVVSIIYIIYIQSKQKIFSIRLTTPFPIETLPTLHLQLLHL